MRFIHCRKTGKYTSTVLLAVVTCNIALLVICVSDVCLAKQPTVQQAKNNAKHKLADDAGTAKHKVKPALQDADAKLHKLQYEAKQKAKTPATDAALKHGDVKNVEMEADQLFRSQKMNTIWEKARQRLSSHDLESFTNDARYIDKQLMGGKKSANNVDKGGVSSLHTDSAIYKLLDSYQLLPHFPEYQKFAASLNSKRVPAGDIAFADKKLAKLWTKAQSAGFTPEELALLEQEFQHHQQNLNNVATPEELRRSDERAETAFARLNDMNRHNEHDSPSIASTTSTVSNKKQSKSGLAAQQQHATTGNEPKTTHFDTRTVEKLWETAQKADFTAQELEVLRGELEQFEVKLEKLRALRSQDEDVVDDGYKLPLVDELGNKPRQLTASVDALYQTISAKMFSAGTPDGADVKNIAAKKVGKKGHNEL